MMSRPRERKNKKAAAGLHEKLQVLRSITHSRAVNPHLRYCFSSPFFFLLCDFAPIHIF
jgi:hypothetical protein